MKYVPISVIVMRKGNCSSNYRRTVRSALISEEIYIDAEDIEI